MCKPALKPLTTALSLTVAIVFGGCGQKSPPSFVDTYGAAGSSGYQLALYNDGTAELRTPQGTVSASYAVQGQTITLTPKAAGPEPMVLQRDANGCLAPPAADTGKALCKQ